MTGGICRRVTCSVCSSEAGRFAQLLCRTQGRRPCRQIIEEKATSDSIVYTDSFRVYKALEVSDFHHMRINHSDLFANRENHINGIENFWNQAKRHLRKFNGIDRDSIHWFLKECEWRFNGGNHQNLYEQLQHWHSKSKH